MNDITSVRKSRHDVRRQLNEALAAFIGPLTESASIAMFALGGEAGLSSKEQELRLRGAAERILELPQLLGDTDEFAANVTALVGQLNNVAEFAADRDFDAHQEAKAAAGEGALPSLDGDGFESPLEVVFADADTGMYDEDDE